MNSNFIRFFMAIMIVLVSIVVKAAPAQWQIVPGQSSISFTATQNNAPVSGKFTAFTGEIFFDPAQLEASQIKIIVDMNSVSTSYQDVANTLKTTDWFDIKDFPQAVYTANHFVKTDGNTFQANGMLTIRNKTIPTVLKFTLEKYTANDALAKGTVTLQRTTFDVGKGEWAKTDSVKDTVIVNFVLVAHRNS